MSGWRIRSKKVWVTSTLNFSFRDSSLKRINVHVTVDKLTWWTHRFHTFRTVVKNTIKTLRVKFELTEPDYLSADGTIHFLWVSYIFEDNTDMPGWVLFLIRTSQDAQYASSQSSSSGQILLPLVKIPKALKTQKPKLFSSHFSLYNIWPFVRLVHPYQVLPRNHYSLEWLS